MSFKFSNVGQPVLSSKKWLFSKEVIMYIIEIALSVPSICHSFYGKVTFWEITKQWIQGSMRKVWKSFIAIQRVCEVATILDRK